jgi:hypothetical protein
MTSPRVVTYCSFAVPETCLGVLILEGEHDPEAASKIAWGLKLNPGGQLMAISCMETDADVPPEVFEAMWENRNKLLTSQEARTLFDAASLKELDAELN